MTDRVRTLSLRVQARRTDAETKQAATRFVSDVLARVVDRLQAEHSGRAVFIRTLKLSLRMLDRALSITTEVDAFSEVLRTHVEERIAAASTASPTASDEVVVFESVAAWRATFIVSEPADQSAWYFADLTSTDGPAAVIGLPDRSLAVATVDALCARTQAFERALARMSAPTLVIWVETMRGLANADGHWSDAPTPHNETFRASRERLVRSVITAARSVAREATADSTRARAADAETRKSGTPRAEEDRPVSRDALVHPTPSKDEAATPSRSRGGETTSDPLAWVSSPTKIARASYLVRLWLTLDVGQTLFLAGLREGTWLAHAIARAAGLGSPDEDALALAVGGPYETPLPVIGPKTIDEVSTRLFDPWMASVTGWTFDPEAALTLSVETHGGSRFVVTRGGRCGMAIAAFVVTSIDEAKRVASRVIGVTPRHVHLHASRALIELDTSRRLEPLTTRAPLLDAETKDDPAACGKLLVEVLAGAALELYALRASLPGPDVAATFAIPGTVLEDEENVVVEIDARTIDIVLRRAGLDTSPGWLEWRRKKMAIEFVGLETW